MSFVSKRGITRQVLPDRGNAVNGVLLTIKRNAVHAVYMVLICVGSVPIILDPLKNSVYRTPIPEGRNAAVYTKLFRREGCRIQRSHLAERNAVPSKTAPVDGNTVHSVLILVKRNAVNCKLSQKQRRST
jgi:hypothetical protein